MSDTILHHSPTSPFAEKIRCVRWMGRMEALGQGTLEKHFATNTVAYLVANTWAGVDFLDQSFQDEHAGTVHVHFPRIGYVLRAVQPV